VAGAGKAARDPAASGAIYRAALSNLVVPLDPALSSKLSHVLVDVTRMHPSRLFSIEAGAAPKGAGLRARIGALCHRRESGGGLVCSEQVVIESDPGSAALIPSAIRSLLVGELPVVLLDLQPGLGVPWVEELAPMADRILLDSCIKEPGKEPEVWRSIHREGSRKVHDIAWARLNPWRMILAELFDDKEHLRALGTIRHVEMGFTGQGDPPPPVWLLAGWLVSRLGWKPEGKGAEGLVLRSHSGPVTLALRSGRPGEGRVLEVIRIRSEEPHPLDVELLHQGREETARIMTRKPRASSMEMTFPYRGFAACIVGEIHRHAPNRPLEEAARAAESLIQLWGRC
jgi:glucose-6-phosphate dehydrogenase assembly protein OpcA